MISNYVTLQMIQHLLFVAKILQKWERNRQKFHLLMPESKYEHLWAQIGKDKIWKDNEVKLIGIRPLLVEMLFIEIHMHLQLK